MPFTDGTLHSNHCISTRLRAKATSNCFIHIIKSRYDCSRYQSPPVGKVSDDDIIFKLARVCLVSS